VLFADHFEGKMADTRNDRNELLKIQYSRLVLSLIENKVSDQDVVLFVFRCEAQATAEEEWFKLKRI
jgi:hypothetical protein